MAYLRADKDKRQPLTIAFYGGKNRDFNESILRSVPDDIKQPLVEAMIKASGEEPEPGENYCSYKGGNNLYGRANFFTWRLVSHIFEKLQAYHMNRPTLVDLSDSLSAEELDNYSYFSHIDRVWFTGVRNSIAEMALFWSTKLSPTYCDALKNSFTAMLDYIEITYENADRITSGFRRIPLTETHSRVPTPSRSTSNNNVPRRPPIQVKRKEPPPSTNKRRGSNTSTSTEDTLRQKPPIFSFKRPPPLNTLEEIKAYPRFTPAHLMNRVDPNSPSDKESNSPQPTKVLIPQTNTSTPTNNADNTTSITIMNDNDPTTYPIIPVAGSSVQNKPIETRISRYHLVWFADDSDSDIDDPQERGEWGAMFRDVIGYDPRPKEARLTNKEARKQRYKHLDLPAIRHPVVVARTAAKEPNTPQGSITPTQGIPTAPGQDLSLTPAPPLPTPAVSTLPASLPAPKFYDTAPTESTNRIQWVSSLSDEDYKRLRVYVTMGAGKTEDLLKQAHVNAARPTILPSSNKSKSKGDGKENKVSSPSDRELSTAAAPGQGTDADGEAGKSESQESPQAPPEEKDPTPPDAIDTTPVKPSSLPPETVSTEDPDNNAKPLTTTSDSKDPNDDTLSMSPADSSTPHTPDSTRKTAPKKPSVTFGAGLKVNTRKRATKVAAAATKSSNQQ